LSGFYALGHKVEPYSDIPAENSRQAKWPETIEDYGILFCLKNIFCMLLTLEAPSQN
jgi:hypothetical protein